MAEAPTARQELTTDVLVVGAGPSGLMLAVCLAKLGVDAIIVDGKQGPTRESRALGVQARSMELYDQLGIV
ncbi:MAG TPA: FAD-dependent monooxygenase, partial [Agromyces sp.]